MYDVLSTANVDANITSLCLGAPVCLDHRPGEGLYPSLLPSYLPSSVTSISFMGNDWLLRGIYNRLCSGYDLSM